MENMQQIYTWKDVDRIIKKISQRMECKYITDIDVYYDEIVISLNDMEGKDAVRRELKFSQINIFSLLSNSV